MAYRYPRTVLALYHVSAPQAERESFWTVQKLDRKLEWDLPSPTLPTLTNEKTMAQFIELTDLNGNSLIVNIEKIDSIDILGVNSTRVVVNRERFLVQEDLWEIVRKLPVDAVASILR